MIQHFTIISLYKLTTRTFLHQKHKNDKTYKLHLSWDSLYCAQFPTVLKISTVRNSLLCPTFLGTVGILRTVETFDLGTVEILSTVGIFEKIIDILLLGNP